MIDLYEIPSLVLCAVLIVALLGSIEIGQIIGRRTREADWDATSGAFLTLSSAAMALLGLLLAFSFSMSVTRHDARQTLTLKEANNIGTAYLRTDLLQPEAAQRTRLIFPSYVDERINYHLSSHDAQAVSASLAKAQVMQNQIWATITNADNYREPKAICLSLLVSSVNDMIDVSGEREFARQNRVPSAVIWLLFVVTLVSGALAGYAFGAKRQRNWLAFIGFAIMISIVVYTILDLDRPRRGLIQVDQAPMLALKAGLR